MPIFKLCFFRGGLVDGDLDAAFKAGSWKLTLCDRVLTAVLCGIIISLDVAGRASFGLLIGSSRDGALEGTGVCALDCAGVVVLDCGVDDMVLLVDATD